MTDSVRTSFTGWVKHLGTALEQDLSPGPDGSLALEFEDDVVIQMDAREDTGGFYLCATICPFPEDAADRYDMLAGSLRFNLEQSQTLQGTLCLAPDDSIQLWFSRPVEAFDADGFVAAFLRFYDTCTAARAALTPLA